MSAAEATKEVVELTAWYTKQIVEALTPIAKQAYDVGLLTLRIDALATLIPSAIIFLLCAYILYRVVQHVKDASEYAENANAGHEGFKKRYTYLDDSASDHINVYFIAPASAFGILGLVAGFINIINLWLWTKLFSPELWLAHQAVEKLLK